MILYYHFLCYVSCYLHLYYFFIVAFIYLYCSSNCRCILCCTRHWCIHLMPYENHVLCHDWGHDILKNEFYIFIEKRLYVHSYYLWIQNFYTRPVSLIFLLHLYILIVRHILNVFCAGIDAFIWCHMKIRSDALYSTPKKQLILELLWSNKDNQHLFHGKRPLNRGAHRRQYHQFWGDEWEIEIF